MSKQGIDTIKSSNKYMINSVDITIMELHRWNMEEGMRSYRGFLTRFRAFIEILFVEHVELQKIGINPSYEYVKQLLDGMLNAQEKKDYILLADLLEMQIRPFLVELQELLCEPITSLLQNENCSITFISNIEALDKQNPRLVQSIYEYLDSEKYKENKQKYIIELTSSGFPTLKIIQEEGEYYQVSNNNPYRDIRTWLIDTICMNRKEYHLLGMAMGYGLTQLYNLTGKVNPIHVFETDLHMIVLALNHIKINHMLQDGVFLHYDPDLTQLNASIKKTQKRDNSLKNDQAQLLIYPPAIQNIQNKELRKSLEKFNLVENSMKNARFLLQGNFMSNISYAKKHPDQVCNVDVLQQEFLGKDVYIIAAGPSLDKNIFLLKEKPKNSIIIATGTVLKKLLKLNIRPDFFIVSDPNERVTSQITGIEDCGVPMLMLSTAHGKFMKNYQGNVFFILQKDYQRAEEEAHFLKNHLYQTGGSVSTIALDIAIHLGANQVIFLGLDLAFTDNLAHAEDTSNRLATDKDDLSLVKAYDGGEVFADAKFILYREWMERRIRQADASKVKIWNATEGGSFVEGMHHVKFASFLELNSLKK
ncbi:MAG TPA: 6-hydroxymethylpterin diphosphokinase MptE-like protein [Lachnospiraceae bacterium]|nr:6-hydroxymethylpterin diphosphokinase MptE-like protein [Lachnospiraceae bacterium]